MSIVKKQKLYFFSSDPTTGATSVSSNGSQFSVALNSPFLFQRPHYHVR